MGLIFSMLTACVCGVLIASAVISIGKIVISKISDFSNNQASIIIAQATSTENSIENEPDTSYIEEADQDPSFVSRFSRVFIYSADNGKEIIESAKNSLPKTVQVKVSAKAYTVIDLDRNAIILEKNEEKLMPIASITKLVTAVVSKKLLNQNQSVVLTRGALSTYGNEARLREGEKLKVEELLYPLLIVSSNDASEIMAQSYPRGRKAFIQEMNNWVNSIGAYRTYFTDPSGLSARNVSTAKDLSIITKWIIENEPDIFDITLLKSKTIRTHTWTNPTHFLNLTSYAGGKNGYTPEANRTSVALFRLGFQKTLYGIILLGSATRDSDILDLLEEALQ
ncbi:MAG: serine hydrolase [Candidatus Taylorbacteria bacterium]|nr:serine hydrolase [Candidatus Taylorbacteria bacterium]